MVQVCHLPACYTSSYFVLVAMQEAFDDGSRTRRGRRTSDGSTTGRPTVRLPPGTPAGPRYASHRGHRGPDRLRRGRRCAEPGPPRLQPGEAPDQRAGGVARWLGARRELRVLRAAHDLVRDRTPP